MTAAAPLAGPGALNGALPIHPRTGLTAVGIVGGKPVWPILGGSGEGDGTGDPAGQAPPQGNQPPAPPAPQPPAGQAPGQQQQGTDPQDIASLPEWAQKQIRDLRTENAGHRTGKQSATQQAQAAQDKLNAVLKAAGLNPDGTEAKADPEALAAKFQQAARSTEVENQVLRIKGIDADRLIDSRAFIDSLDQFSADDPGTPEFKTKIADHVKAYVEQHPEYKAQPAGPARSGGDHPGGGGAPTNRPKSLGAALRAKLGNQ